MNAYKIRSIALMDDYTSMKQCSFFLTYIQIFMSDNLGEI